MFFAAVLFATIAAVDAPDVRVSASPEPAYLAADADGQSLSVDLIVDNQSAEALDLDEIQISVFDRAGKLVLRKFIDGNGTRPRAGQRVRQGDVLASIGASGSSKFPHLHFELQNGPDVSAEGLPSVFENYERILGSRRVRVRSGRVSSGDIVNSR